MKKRCLAFILCVHTVLFMMFQVASNVIAEEGAATQIDAQTDNEENTQGQAENSSEWLSYEDFMLLETTKAWNDPAMYVGFTAEFNTEMYDNFACVSGGDAIDFGSDADVSGGDADVSGGDADITDDDTDYSGDDTEFFYSGEDFYEKLSNFANFVYAEELFDAEGNSIKAIITDYYYDDTSDSLWYKVEAAEGYILPDVLVENPYVLHLTYPEESPSFFMLPRKGMLVGDKVIIQKEPVAASRYEEVAVDELPDFFDITWSYEYTENGLSWYDFGDISGWAENLTPEYRYISTSSVKLIPAEVSRAYEMLLSMEDMEDYNIYWFQIPEEITRQFTDKHLVNLEKHQEDLFALENVEYSTSVMIGGKEIPVTVRGKIPKTGVKLSASVVSTETVMQEGFDIKDATEIVAALDIKIINDEDGTEWQPKEGKRIWVSIGMSELGYADGSILKLQHKHGEKIDIFDVFVVVDGKVTVGISGFSMFVVSQEGSYNQTGQRVNNNESFTLEVGQERVFYFDLANRNIYEAGTWTVIDTSGAIHYTVHSDSSSANGGIDSNGIYAPWIKIHTLKETTTETQITLRFDYADINENPWPGTVTGSGYETYTLNIVAPRAEGTDEANKYRLYIKDTVNTTGTITATLVDKDGNEVTEEELGGTLTCSWVRSDGSFIIPAAYQNNGKSIDICRDHGGLLQTRLTNVTYTVTATLPNGREKTASYTVYYQSEILNAGFEMPELLNRTRTYTFLTNGWPNLYWKTTSPGDEVNLSRDIELARYNDTNNGDFDYPNVTFFPNQPDSGRQIAEINAENFGALYQDIITAPEESVAWAFSHAKRDLALNGEAMFIILGPTEYAQKVTTYNQLRDLIDQIITGGGYADRTAAINHLNNSTNGKRNSIRYEDPSTKAVYEIWYHNADDGSNDKGEGAWTELEGEYVVPSKQYRTRLFFVSDPEASDKGGEANYGNLIDSSRAGQYKKYLIEYYEEDYVTDDTTGATDIKRTHLANYDEKGRAPIYSSVNLKNFDDFEAMNEILSTVYINGVNSPYNVRYSGVPCLFIEKYSPDASTTPHLVDVEEDSASNDYTQYDIVMQVCFRKTMVAVQKWVIFPKIGNTNNEALTMEQKQSLIDGLKTNKGYEAHYILDCQTEECKKKEEGHLSDSSIYITKNDPKGWYTGYIPMGKELNGTHSFKLTESFVSPLEGLEIAKVELKYYQFHKGQLTLMGKKTFTDIDYTDYNKDLSDEDYVGEGCTSEYINSGVVELENDPDGDGYKLVYNNKGVKEEVFIDGIDLNSADEKRKIAEVKVTNTYKEKQVKMNYVAVGDGKITIQDGTSTDKIEASETFLYYSGKPYGARPTPEHGYTFAGWYLDEDCTIPVDENHGYVDIDTNAFVPNKAKTISDDVLEVTYYAKFSIGSLQIIREDAEPGQVFVYEVKDTLGETMYVTVVIGDDRTGSTEIVNASFGDNEEGRYYTVTQLNNWSWRYKNESPPYITKLHIITDGLHGAQNMTTVFKFPTGEKNEDPDWLNGNSPVETNTYGGGAN